MKKREIIILIIVIIFSAWRFIFFTKEKIDFSFFENKKIQIQAIVEEDPDVRLDNQYLKVKILNSKEHFLVKTNLNKIFEYKDTVEIKGILEKPKNFITENGKEFDYVKYLKNQDIYFIVNYPEIQIIKKDDSFSFKKILFSFKNSFNEKIKKYISHKESSLAGGIVLGMRGSFDKDFKQDLVDTGTIHIVALSGYNVSVVAGSLIKFFSIFLGSVVSIILGFIFLVFFILMTGASVTSIRAGIMAGIMLLGKIYGKEYLAGRVLFIAGFLMVVYDYRVLSDLSFQLSFLATWGVLFLNPLLYNKFYFLPVRFGFRDSITTTISATMAVLPILVYQTGSLSVVSILVNSLILVFIPITMFMIFITGFFGFVFPFFAIIFGFISTQILRYIIFIIEYFGSLPFASVNIINFPLWLTIFVYLLMFIFVFLKNKKHSV